MDQLKIATYNIRFGGKVGNRVHWQKLLEEEDPDILLMQETLAPEGYLSEDFYRAYKQQFFWRSVGERHWGSAVFVRRGRVVALPPLSSELVGWVSGVEVVDFGWPLAVNESLYVYSVHAPSGRRSYVMEVNRILDAIESQIPPEATVIIGGDFNLTVGLRHATEKLQQSRRKLMDRFRRLYGLASCWQMAHPNHDLPQTLRWSKDKIKPFHCDGIFAPAIWYRFLESSDVLCGADWAALSDHNPVIAFYSCPCSASSSSRIESGA